MTPQEIKELRVSLGITQKKLAELMNVTVSTVSFWETGRRNPGGTAIRLLEVLKEKAP